MLGDGPDRGYLVPRALSHSTVSKRYKNLFPVPVASKYLSGWY
eukprot:SAG11_NODE_27934_length_327_cov_0.671053_1_plen_42_part_01